MKTHILLGLFLSASIAKAQLTPVNSLPLKRHLVEVPKKFNQIMKDSFWLNIPDGYKAKIFQVGQLTKPRFISFSPNGVLHVSDQSQGKIVALPDSNNDGIADTTLIAASGFNANHDVKFFNGNMYVTEQHKVWKLSDLNNDGFYEDRQLFIDSLGYKAAIPSGGHVTRSVVFDSVNQKVYVSIGSSCNVCREEYRSVIEQYDLDGKNGRVFASGVRNAVGLVINPVTNRLWANNNGSDNQGNEIPPEWIDLIREDGFYGHPFAYGNKTWFNFNTQAEYQALLPITKADSFLVNKLIVPAAQIEAHSAPMGITYLNNSFPEQIKNGMLTALRGSWNAPGDQRGYKISYIDFTDKLDTTANYVADFCSGFLTDSNNGVSWARPVGIAVNNKGEVFMTSDGGYPFILKLYPATPVGVDNITNLDVLSSYPNPADKQATIALANVSKVNLFTVQGKQIKVDYLLQPNQVEINTTSLANGIYYVELVYQNNIARSTIIVRH